MHIHKKYTIQKARVTREQTGKPKKSSRRFLAGCSADCPEMWQIGIDVLPEYRRQGVASVLTSRLAKAIFERGKVPFYASAWFNIRSMRNAARSGFKPAWAALTAATQ